MSAPRGFKPAELAWAMRLRKQRKSWKHIARSLGRTTGDGIKRRLDAAYRERRNAYHANQKRLGRALRPGYGR